MTISNFSTKLLAFLLVPLYTNILTTKEYGVFDLSTTTIALLIPVLALDIKESVLRFSLDENKDKKRVFLVYMKFFLHSILIIFIGRAVIEVLKF